MGHVCIFNTLALKKMGISETAPDPKGGFYERMSDGKTLTGKAIEKNAYNPNTSYQRVAAMRDEKRFVHELQETTQAMLQWGITSYQNMCTGTTAGDFIKMWQKAGLPFRLRLIRWGDINPDETLSIPGKELPKKILTLPLVTVSGTKWLLEGTPDEEYAEQFEPYPDRENWYGKMNYTLPEIERMIREAIERRDQLMFHIVGDKSIGKLLDLMEKMKIDWKPLRPRFEHADKIDYLPKYLEQAKRMGIIVIENPTNFSEDIPSIRKTSPFDMAMKTLLSKGIPLGIGSDGPFNPFLNIMFAVTHPRRPSEAITREEAVIAYTAINAFAEFEEKNKGTLTVGKVADLAVLSQNIFEIPVAELPETKSVLTMVNGKIVYDAQVLKLK
jgi:predicted amidohydrolase YtcJ